ncbi:NAD(P)-binding protein [Penicillium soppii]|uniref:NAD(P)-binding protein n=1 Tax=Penicillium soppii TaxID=69789 RepID=UPI002548D437|nr:NAD(P)-binding protein [Penicillium soppii]KAJ5852127.1 NAD(P)-binding protein [Penicillium soppii]
MNSQISLNDTLKESYNHGTSFTTSSMHKLPQKAFLFGHPISHSLAPLLHKILFQSVSLPWAFSLVETQDISRFLPALYQPNTIGCAVTMPYKVSLMSAVDCVTDESRTIGAMNTVFRRTAPDGRTINIGTNTDCIGIREAFLYNYPGILAESTGKPALVIGGGGACRAAVYALWKWMGASRIYMVNRVESEVRAIMGSFRDVGFGGDLVWIGSVEMAEGLEGPVVVVGTVPDVVPVEEGEILARRIVEVFLGKERKGFVLEMCYHPKPRTEFFALCQKAGWEVLCGTEAMIWQGIAQQILWTELPFGMFDLKEAAQRVTDMVQSH